MRLTYAPRIPDEAPQDVAHVYHLTMDFLASRRHLAGGTITPRRRYGDAVMLGLATAAAGVGVALRGGGLGGGGGGGGGGIIGGSGSVAEESSYSDHFALGASEPWYEVRRGTWTIGGSAISSSDTVGAVQAILDAARHTYTDCTVEAVGGSAMTWSRAGVCARGSWSGSQWSGYAARVSGTSIQLIRIVSDAIASLGTVPAAVAPTDRLGVRCTGTTIEALHNGATVLSVIDATHASGHAALLRTSAIGLGATEYDELIVQV